MGLAGLEYLGKKLGQNESADISDGERIVIDGVPYMARSTGKQPEVILLRIYGTLLSSLQLQADSTG